MRRKNRLKLGTRICIFTPYNFFLLLVGTFTKRREHRKFVNVVNLFMCGPAKRFRSVSDYNKLSSYNFIIKQKKLDMFNSQFLSNNGIFFSFDSHHWLHELFILLEFLTFFFSYKALANEYKHASRSLVTATPRYYSDKKTSKNRCSVKIATPL